MYIDSILNGSTITTWARNETQELVEFTTDAPYYYYEETPNDTGMTTIFGDFVEKKEFASRADMTFARANTMKAIHESDISPLYKFLSDTFHDRKNKNLHIGYFDIEVDFDLSDGIGYPTPDNPYGEINSVSLFNAVTQEYHMVVLDRRSAHNIKLSDADHPVHVHECVTERQLLTVFIDLIEDIDVLSAWNGDFYDIPYIVLRCIKYWGESQGRKMLCRGGFPAERMMKRDAYDNEVLYFELVGRVHLDMMKVYKNSTFGERPSYRLDAICEHEKIGRKIDYKGDLGELYRTDPQRFFDYSLHDSRLMKDLDEKMGIIELSIIRAQASTIRYTDIYGSIKPLEMKIRNYVHYERSEPMVLPDKEDNHKESFDGAFVIPTHQSIFGWSSSIDLEGLYPSVMRTINISPDTHLFQCMDDKVDFVKVVERSNDPITVMDVQTKRKLTTTGDSLMSLIKAEGLTISAYGSVFAAKKGLLPEVLDLWVTTRKESKAKMFEYQDLYNNTSEKETTIRAELKDKIDFFNTKQLLAKLDNNSLYGAVSNPYCRFYTIHCAASVTSTGQIIEKHQIANSDRILDSVANG